MTYFYRNEDLTNLVELITKKKSHCTCCGKDDFIIWTKLFDEKIQSKKCSNCGFVFMDPYPSDECLDIYYNDYLSKRRLSNQKKMNLRDKQYVLDSKFITDQLSTGKILDIGCNGGFFLNKLPNTFEKYGLDVDKEAIEFGKKNFDFKENLIHDSFLHENYAEDFFDAIILRGTIEHLTNPHLYVQKIFKILKGNGIVFIIATPNIDSISAKIFKKHWTLFHPIQHISHFSVKNLKLLFEKYNLKLYKYEYPYLKTPYENVYLDIFKFIWCFFKMLFINDNKILNSPPFFKNMMSVSFIKQKK